MENVLEGLRPHWRKFEIKPTTWIAGALACATLGATWKVYSLGISLYTLNQLVLAFNVFAIYFFYQLAHGLQNFIGVSPQRGFAKIVLEFLKVWIGIFITNFLQYYFVTRPLFGQNFDPNIPFLMVAFAIPAAALGFLIYCAREVKTKPYMHRILLLLLSGLGSALTIVLVHGIYQHASVYAVNLLVLTFNVISIYFFYHVFDTFEIGLEFGLAQAIGAKPKHRTFRFFLEFSKLFASIFITNLLQFYLVGRPIFNQNYDPNLWFIVLAFSIPSAAIARIVFELRQAQELALQSRLAQAEAQYNLLEAQMQPHFLFNSLNVLSELIYVDPDLACSVTQQLADLYREILTNSKQKFSNLGSEISILKKYIQIQKIRFGDRIRFKSEIDPSYDDLSVPSLILQTLVENAIKHGISPRQEGGDIELTVQPVEGRGKKMYEITVSNTGELYKGPKSKELGTGLQNTKNRLELFYGRSHGFNIYSDDNKTYVKFRVPQEREPQETNI